MDEETQERIKETVLDILKNGNMDEMTESKVRKTASEKLDMDLSEPTWKKFVREVVESYIRELQAKSYQQEEEEGKDNSRKREYDDDGGLIICRLSKYRRVTISEYKGKTLVSIREYFSRGGKEFPTAKGISLTCEQWASFKKHIPAIEKAVTKMESM